MMFDAALLAQLIALGQLTWTLTKIGLLTYGGGFAIIALIQAEVVGGYGWLTTKEFIDGIAMGQITPGPILITATFIGYKLMGLLGATVATIAMFVPSVLLYMATTGFLLRMRRQPAMMAMLRGMRALFVGMLALMVLRFGPAALVDYQTMLLGGVAVVGLLVFKWDPVYIILGGIVASLLMFSLPLP